MKKVNPAEAYWNKRCMIADLTDRFDQLSEAIGFENDLNTYQWAQLSAFVLEYQPDLVVELGRKHGNSTCLFTETVRHLPSACQVVSICWSNEFEQKTIPKLLEKNLIDKEWMTGLSCVTADIRGYDYASLLAKYDRVILFWDAHGFDVASCVIGGILPLLERKEHYVLMHDLSDQRYMCDDLYRYNGSRLWHGDSHSGERLVLGHINSAVAQAVSIYDFCSRNRIWIESADHTIHELFGDKEKKVEMENILGERYFSFQGHWFFLSLNEWAGPFTYPSWKPEN